MQIPLDRILREVERPARYLGGEHNSIVKSHAGVPVRAVLAFPDTYEIGMSHLGLRILYDVLNRRGDMLLERCFAPWPDMEAALRRHRVPLFSLETRTPLGEFDCIGFSLQYELGFTNVLMMLDLAGLPLRAEERDESHPLVVGGGPVAFSPEPVADFFDAFLIGDGEEAFPRLLERHAAMKRELADLGAGSREDRREARRRVLRALAGVPGVYVPSLYDTAPDRQTGLRYVVPRDAGTIAPPFPIRRAVLDDLNRFPFPADTIVPHPEIVHDRVSVEIARGCTEGCRFCQAGTIYRPVRERTAESIVNSALCGLSSTGYNEINLSSLSPADYSTLPLLVEKLMDTIADSQVGLAVSSLRPYGLTEELARQISRVTRTGFTIAPDAGTQRMRDVLNKGISEEHILTAARNAFREGWDLIKLYFIIGLPTETDEDLAGMVDLANRIWQVGRVELGARNRGAPRGRVTPRVHFSASSLVPKPHTPFQWVAMESVESLYRKERFIADRVRNRNIRFKHHQVETSRLEGLLSRGDRRLGRVIERAYRLGCRFDGWTEQIRFDLWCRALDEEGLTFDEYLRELPLDSSLPWDHVDTTVTKAFQLREWKRALRGALSPGCEKPYKKYTRPFREGDKLVCYDCGSDCDLPAVLDDRLANHRNLLQLAPQPRPLGPPDPSRPAFRYRAVFEKTGDARFLGHLDVTRAFARAFRRAEIALRTSQGFNPKPAFAFGPALALGIEGREERFDFALGSAWDGAEMMARLNRVLPRGLRVLEIAPLTAGAEPLSSSVSLAHYSVRLPLWIEPAPRVNSEGSTRVSEMPFNEESALRGGVGRGAPEAAATEREDEADDDAVGAGAASAHAATAPPPAAPVGGDIAWHRERLRAFESVPSLPCLKLRKGRKVEVDLKQFVSGIEICGNGERRPADGGRDEVVLELAVHFIRGATVRPEEVLVGVYGFLPRGARIARERLIFEAAARPEAALQPARR